MAKRIKKVFSSSDQVIHLWANQSQTEARSRNVFFKGTSIWSYGFHYELGRLIQFKGKTFDFQYFEISARAFTSTKEYLDALIKFINS